MTSYSVTVQREIPEQLLKDILTTAVEGGSHYWLFADSIKRDKKGNVIRIIGPMDAETGEAFDESFFAAGFNPAPLDITLETVLQGIRRLTTGPVENLSEEIRKRYIGAILGDPEDFFAGEDAGTADNIVQIGLFGEVVFG